MTRRFRFVAALAAVTLTFCTAPASAMTIKEFRKFTKDEQSMFIGAAVSMLAYSYAANGNVPKARCIQTWYYGQKGGETPGPREITIEIGVAESLDAEKYQIEGVILGATDKACPGTQTPAKPKQ